MSTPDNTTHKAGAVKEQRQPITYAAATEMFLEEMRSSGPVVITLPFGLGELDLGAGHILQKAYPVMFHELIYKMAERRGLTIQ